MCVLAHRGVRVAAGAEASNNPRDYRHPQARGRTYRIAGNSAFDRLLGKGAAPAFRTDMTLSVLAGGKEQY